MILQISDIENIIKNNPNKKVVEFAQKRANQLMLHVYGESLKQGLKQNDYFESKDIYNERVAGAISNMDLFSRLLQRESMVFNAQGGSAYYEGLNEKQTTELNSYLENVRFEMSIRKWIEKIALQAYRTDPMSLIFIEVSKEGTKVYPTYKSIACIFDYKTNGRKLDYVIFKIEKDELPDYDIEDAENSTSNKSLEITNSNSTAYFRVVDDTTDRIVKNRGGIVELLSELPNTFGEVPAIVTSDLMEFKDYRKFNSPLKETIELADQYLHDRSVRNLSKKFTGFPKAYELATDCGTCRGSGFVGANACPDCTPSGGDRGIGKKITTKVSDVTRIQRDDSTNFDYKKYNGYITPPIEIWDKQDNSLNDIENLMNFCYWGIDNSKKTTGPNANKDKPNETATKTLVNLQPIYTRLNLTADWAEQTENKIINFIGKFKYGKNFISSQRTYGRYYIIETPEELMQTYLDQKTKGAAISILDDSLEKYYHSVYEDNKLQLTIQLKLMKVEPFIHYNAQQVQAMNPSRIDYIAKLYFSEWKASKDRNYFVDSKPEAMVADLLAFATIKIPEIPEIVDGVAVSETESTK